MKRIFFPLLAGSVYLLIGLAGCTVDNSEKPDDLIEEDAYINLLAELQLVQSYHENLPQDSLSIDSLQNQIYEHYNITEERFVRSHEYYREDMQAQAERLDEAIERLRKDKVQLEDSTESES